MQPIACAVFLVLSFVLTGVCQTVWFRSQTSKRFMIPIDLGKTYRGKRVFGDNKTLRGFIVMVPAAAGSFFLLGLLSSYFGIPFNHIWPLSLFGYAFLGFWAGLGFMLGELPNSFLKRQFGIEPGKAPVQFHLKILFLLVDRIDSIIGMLIATSLVVKVPWQTWLYLGLFGPIIHLFFSLILYRNGEKKRML